MKKSLSFKFVLPTIICLLYLSFGGNLFKQKVQDPLAVTQRYTFPVPTRVRHVIIDIGLYNNIIEPRRGEFTIAIDASLREIDENSLSSKCESYGSCLLLNAAIGEGNSDPFVNLHQSIRPGGSSHITNFDSSKWPMELRPAVVPLVSLKTIIDAVPQELPIILCKTDTNGNDVGVLKSAGTSLTRCLHIILEIVGPEDGTGPPDQYEKALDIALSHGFRLDPLYASAKQESGSYNLYFKRPEAQNFPDIKDLILERSLPSF